MALNAGTLYPQHIVLTHNTAADWSADNPILLQGELGLESDTLRIKIGDGRSTWDNLSYTDSDLRTRIDTLEAQFQSLADSLHVYYNALAAKTFREELES